MTNESNEHESSTDPAGRPEQVVSFAVTGNAMRPASDNCECFYCQVPIGGTHKPDCVLVRKKVKVRMIVEYEIEVPYSWDKEQIEFHRNDGSWCSDNALEELEALGGEDACICPVTEFVYIGEETEPYLDES